MYSVSEDYKEAIRQRVVNDRIAGSITLSDGTKLTISDRSLVKNSLKISHELCDDYRIGTFHIGCLQIAVFDDNALLRDFSGARIEPVYEIETAKGWESVPMGIYYADGNSVRRKRNTVSLTAYDCGCFFDQVIPEERRSLWGSAEKLVAAACADCGVPFGGIPETLPNYGVMLSAADTQVRTYRDMIAWCAELLCAYAVIDREGKLWFRSAKYGVSQTDNTDIVIDKYLTEAERDSITVTDTRAYIRSICAYIGSVLKTYVSDTVQTDEQAAPAGYTFSENPLLRTSLTLEEREKVNTDRLAFIDGFKQRGINAEIYGDPALDVGDVLRCSGGDIDQRRSIVGLVTKQEWRYRNFHTVVCAAPPLLGRDAASAAVVTSQTDKKVDALSLKCQYAAGKGIEINGNTINMKVAKVGAADYDETGKYLGGVYVGQGLKIDYDGRLYIPYPTKNTAGTISIGNGLMANSDRECSVKLGEGMRYNELDGQSISPNLGDGFKIDPSEDKEDPDYGKIHLNLGKGLAFGARVYEKKKNDWTDSEEDDPTRYTSEVQLKLGEGLKFGENGELIATATGGKEYKAGENITISEDGTISAEVKEYTAGENITISEDGEISATGEGIAIDQAVIIKEADAKYLLHNFTQIEYNAGNRIGYTGPGNQIVIQGYIAYPYAVLNEGTNGASASKWYYPENGVPNYSRYSEVSADFYSNTTQIAYKKSYLKQTAVTPDAGTYSWLLTRTDDVDVSQGAAVNEDHWSGIGLLLEWLDIYPPGHTVGSKVFENGCANIRFHYIRKSNTNIANDQIYERVRMNTNYLFPFATLAEYQAAVGLTYEPLTLTEVTDSPAVVSGSEVN